MSMALLQNSPKPLYEQVSDVLRRRVADATYRPGTALPSEYQLASELGVSQGTVRKALNDLVAERILFRRQGLGTFVAQHTEQDLLFVYFNIARDDGTRRLPVSKTLSIRRHPASREERDRLKLHAGAKVLRIKRLRFFEGDPMMIEYLALPAGLFPHFGEDEQAPDHLYQYYQSKYGLTVAKAQEKLKAVIASDDECKLLDVPAGTPLLRVDRIALTIEMQPVEWRISLCDTRGYHCLCERG
jgi:GntR family transcriptional regulator